MENEKIKFENVQSNRVQVPLTHFFYWFNAMHTELYLQNVTAISKQLSIKTKLSIAQTHLHVLSIFVGIFAIAYNI